jgi:signal transduction histidine kinase
LGINWKKYELSNDDTPEYASKVGTAVAKERNQFARDVHDSVGHTMTLLISLLGVCKLTLRNDMEMTDKKLDEALKTAREGLDEIRNSIKGLSLEKLEVTNIEDSLEILVENFKRSGVDIDLNVSGSSSNIDIQVNYVLFRTLQEALTNSVRHGKATKVMVYLQSEIKLIKMFIMDNGIGCKKIVKGMGLCGMEERVRSLGGTIVYGSDGELGFNVHIEIPLREE